MNTTQVSNVVVAGIDHHDYPDFCDAYIQSADYNGVPMTEKQLDELNDDRDFVHQEVFKEIY